MHDIHNGNQMLQVTDICTGHDNELIIPSALGRRINHHPPHACVDRLANDPGEQEEDNGFFFHAQAELQSNIRQLLVLERPPPVVLGSGRTSLPNKLAATMHALYLETGSARDLGTLTSEITSCTSDLGTEFNIVRVQGARARELLPWLSVEVPANEDDWPVEDEFLHFPNAFAVPGILHILHNAAKRMLTGLPELSAAVDALSAVAEMIRKKHTKERLVQRCFSSEVGQQLRPLIEAFKGKVHVARWGAIAFATSQILHIERPLRWGWNLDLFLGPAADQASEQAVKARAVDEALTAEYSWASVKIIDKIHKAARHLFAWAEGCPCHGAAQTEFDHDHEGHSKAWVKLQEQSPLRGRRCAEIACGYFLEELRQRLETSAVEVLLDMSPSLTPEQQNTLMAEFERGKASLLFNIALKVGPMRVPPLLVFGVAHFNRAKAQDALRACLASDSTEGLMAELKSPVILAEARAFLEGDCLAELPSFCAFVGKLRLAYSVERGIEGEHASIHHFIRKAPNHTVAYVGLKRRMPQRQSHLIGPQFLDQLSMFLEKVRNPKLAAHELGLRNHPALADDPYPWDPIFAKIVYRSDPVTTQAPSAPIEVRALPGAGPRRLGPQPQPIADSEASPAGGYLPEVVHQAALEHFRVRLQEECSDSGPDAGERAFSIFVSQAVMSALFQVPAVQLPDSHATSLPDLPHAPAVADSVVQQAGPSLAIQEQDSQGGLPESSLQQGSGSGSGLPDFFQDAIVQLRKPKDPNLPKAFAFKIVSLNPSQSKLPLQGTFQATDVGVSVLRTVALDTVKRLWVVDAEPLKLLPSANSASSSAGPGVSGSAQGSADICDIGPTVPIVFSPSSIPLKNPHASVCLEVSLRHWPSAGQVCNG